MTERNTEPLTPREKNVLGSLVVLMCLYMVYLTMFSRGPVVYSFEEHDRAKAACQGSTEKNCEQHFMKNWRKAHPDEPSGSKP